MERLKDIPKGEKVGKGDRVSCPRCGKWHPIILGIREDGEQTDDLMGIDCPERPGYPGTKRYIVGMFGRLLKNYKGIYR